MSSKYRNTSLIYIVNVYLVINIKVFITLKHFSFHLLGSENSVQIYNVLGLKQFLKSGVCVCFERRAIK